jgi:hypothetical protein
MARARQKNGIAEGSDLRHQGFMLAGTRKPKNVASRTGIRVVPSSKEEVSPAPKRGRSRTGSLPSSPCQTHFRAEGAACTPAPWRFLERFDAQGIGAGIPSRCSYPTNGKFGGPSQQPCRNPRLRIARLARRLAEQRRNCTRDMVRLRSVELVYFATPLRFGPMLLSQRIL